MARFYEKFITVISLMTLRDPAVVRRMEVGTQAWVFTHALLTLLMLGLFYFVYSLILPPVVAIGMTALMIIADLALGQVMERRQMLAHNAGAASGTTLHYWRIASCLVIATSIGYSTVVAHNSDEIDRRSAQRLAAELAPLVAHLDTAKQDDLALYVVPVQQSRDATMASLPALQAAIKDAEQALSDNDQRQTASKIEAIRQEGGVDGRSEGCLALCRAAKAEADLAQTGYASLLIAHSGAVDALKNAQSDLLRLDGALKTAQDKVAEVVTNTTDEIHRDPRWRDQISGGLIQRSVSLVDMMGDGVTQCLIFLAQILVPIVIAIFVETLLLSFSVLMTAAGVYHAEAQEMHTHAHGALSSAQRLYP